MIKYFKKYELTGYTAIFPSVGVGNVAQLSTDLIISTLAMEKIATINHVAIIPMIGPRAFEHDSDKFTTACELYIAQSQKLAVFQVRSPLVAAFMQEFFENLAKILISEQFSRLIIFTSSYAYEMHVVEATPFEYLASEEFKQENDKKLKDLNWSLFNGNVIHGGGYAKRLMETVEKDIETIILFKYVTEGDNTVDAMQLVEHFNKFCNFLPRNDKGELKLLLPISWKLLFGNSKSEQLY